MDVEDVAEKHDRDERVLSPLPEPALGTTDEQAKTKSMDSKSAVAAMDAAAANKDGATTGASSPRKSTVYKHPSQRASTPTHVKKAGKEYDIVPPEVRLWSPTTPPLPAPQDSGDEHKNDCNNKEEEGDTGTKTISPLKLVKAASFSASLPPQRSPRKRGALVRPSSVADVVIPKRNWADLTVGTTATIHRRHNPSRKVTTTTPSSPRSSNSPSPPHEGTPLATPEEDALSASAPVPSTPPMLKLMEDVGTMVHILSFCGPRELCEVQRVSHRLHDLASSDELWLGIMEGLNLRPLLTCLGVKRDYYLFFVNDVITSRALHGHYSFTSVATVPQTSSSNDMNSISDIFPIDDVKLLISAASLGQMNHSIGRVQLLCKYKNDTMEVLQGTCRFSIHRRCYAFCCNAFGSTSRGPIFTIAIATVLKPWPSQCPQHFASHKGGIRLVMTPVLWEGSNAGSQITEKDVIAVSKPPPELV